MSFLYRARLSFPSETRGLVDTGRLMARVAADLAELLAPELTWQSRVAEHSDWGDPTEWEASHVVALIGRDREGVERGRGESRLVAGGRGSRIGGSGRVVLDAVGPVRHLRLHNQCDVTHWDVFGGPFDAAAIGALQATLSEAVGAPAQVAGPKREPLSSGASDLATDVSPADMALWLSDLESVGLVGVKRTGSDGAATLALASESLSDIDALEDARVTLGEILAEGGADDWDERARVALLGLQRRSEP